MYCTVLQNVWGPPCSVLEWDFMSNLIDGGAGGGSALLIAATGSTTLLINL